MMRIAISAIALLGAACAEAPASIPDPAAPQAEAGEHSPTRPAYGAASLGSDSAAKQPLGRQVAPNSDVLPPPPPGQRSPDESPTNKYHVTQAQVDLFQNPNNLTMTVARQFVWDQWKLAWWAQHHKEDFGYIKTHHLLFNHVKVRFNEGFVKRPHMTGTMVMQMRAVAYEFPIPRVRDENGTVINNGLRADPLSHVEGDAPGAEDWYQQKAATRLPSSWSTQIDYPGKWNKVWENSTRLDVIPQNWFSQFMATLDQPLWQTVWDAQPPRSPPPSPQSHSDNSADPSSLSRRKPGPTSARGHRLSPVKRIERRGSWSCD